MTLLAGFRVVQLGRGMAAAVCGLPFGKLDAGGPADLVVLDYRPPTPLDAGNLGAHLLFGVDRSHVASVMVAGSSPQGEERSWAASGPSPHQAANASLRRNPRPPRRACTPGAAAVSNRSGASASKGSRGRAARSSEKSSAWHSSWVSTPRTLTSGRSAASRILPVAGE